LFRFFEREVKMGAKLLQDVRQDLADVVQVCEGKKKQTNYLRTLINELVKGADGVCGWELVCHCPHPMCGHTAVPRPHVSLSGFLNSGGLSNAPGFP
jgi:hypothetical protein